MLVLNDKVPLMISKQLAQKYNAIPVDLQLNKLTVAISKENLYALEDLTMATGKEIIFKVEDEEKIKRSIEKYYSKMRYIEEDFSRQMIDNILQKAIILKSSDIHIEPFEHILKIRMRVDGSLKEINEYNIDMYSQLSTIIKLYSGMDIAEKRLPQDGRIDKAINGEVFDLRVSTIPTIYGEKIVIRILNRDILLKTKQDIGFSSQVESRVNSMLKSMSGLILITGPTGSGKTTTLYSIVNEFKDMDKNIVTIEDPVEYKIHGVNQIQVNEKIGLEFSVGLRSILRQDPDVIIVGEIRDPKTAEIAIRAASTGHLVISTMHTNNSIESINRLIDMGIPKYLISSALRGIISQKLINKLCSYCSYEEDFNVANIYKLPIENISKVKVGKGCIECSNTGHKERVGLYEIIEVNKAIKKAISLNEYTEDIYSIAKDNNMITFLDSAEYLLRQNKITIQDYINIMEINN